MSLHRGVYWEEYGHNAPFIDYASSGMGDERAGNKRMTTLKRTYRLQIMLNAEELAILDAWRFEKRMPSRSDAVRELLRLGRSATGYNAHRRAIGRFWNSRSARPNLLAIVLHVEPTDGRVSGDD
jgi:hypothetical protein